MRTTKSAQKNQNSLRARIGITALLLLLAASGGSILNSYEDVPVLTRSLSQVNIQQDYQDTGTESAPCPLAHQSKLPISKLNLVIDMPAIKAHTREKLGLLKQFTTVNYERFMMNDAGKEHFTLFHWLTKTFQDKDDCRHVMDIGTRYVASALALGATGVPVKTFDLPHSQERFSAFRGKSEQEWQAQLKNTAPEVDIQFHNLNLLNVSDADFRTYMSTWLISLDTFHQPYSVPFEREFLDRLIAMKPKYEGLLLLDDINLNKEMKTWWEEVQANADKGGYIVYDLTEIGHFSGTGLLDFSGRVVIKKD